MVVRTPVEDMISHDAMKFAEAQRILEYVEKAMEAAREVFADAGPITATLKRDPEVGELYVEVHVVLHEEEQPETAAEKDAACLGEWGKILPANVGNICLSTSWVS